MTEKLSHEALLVLSERWAGRRRTLRETYLVHNLAVCELERAGLVRRHRVGESMDTHYHGYGLTPAGHELAVIADVLLALLEGEEVDDA